MLKFSHTKYTDYLILFFLAFIVRLLFLFQFQHVIIFDNPIVDMAYHHNWALSIASGEQFYSGPFFRAPLYPLFVGFVYWLFGESNWIIRIIQAGLGSVSCVLLYELGCTLFNRKTGILASVIMALYAPLIFFDAQLLAPSLAICLNLSALLFIVRTQTSQLLKDYLFAGLFLGLAIITRPTIGLFALVVIIFLMYRSRKQLQKEIKKILLLVLCLCIPILPITVYNYLQSSEITFVAAYGGINFYIGNYSGADGVSAVIPGVRQDWQGGKEDTKAIAEKEIGRTLSESELSKFWLQKGMDDITADPFRWLSLVGKKVLLLFNGIELSNNFDFYYFAQQTSMMKILLSRKVVFFPFAVLIPFALLGLITHAHDNTKSKILLIYTLTTVASIILFLVTARYRLYLIPPLILYASFMVFYLIENWKSLITIRKITLSIILILFFVGSNQDIYGYAKQTNAHGYHTTASIYNSNGNMSKAEEFYNLALKADPNQLESINDFALLLTAQKKYSQAESLLVHGISLPNVNYSMHYNLGYLYLVSNKLEKAKEQFQIVIKERPDYLFAHNNLGLTYMWLGQLDSSLVVYNNLIKNYPTFPDSYFNLGLVWIEKDISDSAGFYFQSYIKQPNSNSTQRETALYLLDSLGFSQ